MYLSVQHFPQPELIDMSDSVTFTYEGTATFCCFNISKQINLPGNIQNSLHPDGSIKVDVQLNLQATKQKLLAGAAQAFSVWAAAH